MYVSQTVASVLTNNFECVNDYCDIGCFGSECLAVYGITVPEFVSWMFFYVYVTDYKNEDLRHILKEFSSLTNNMHTTPHGNGTIIYFPKFKLPVDSY